MKLHILGMRLAVLAAVLSAGAAFVPVANANAVVTSAAVASATAAGNNRQEANTSIVAGGAYSDGFVVARRSYRDGPTFRVCLPPEGYLESSLVIRNGQCMARKDTEQGSLFNPVPAEYIPAREGSLQERLDDEFGPGVTTFTGVGLQGCGRDERLVIFYRVANNPADS